MATVINRRDAVPFGTRGVYYLTTPFPSKTGFNFRDWRGVINFHCYKNDKTWIAPYNKHGDLGIIKIGVSRILLAVLPAYKGNLEEIEWQSFDWAILAFKLDEEGGGIPILPSEDQSIVIIKYRTCNKRYKQIRFMLDGEGKWSKRDLKYGKLVKMADTNFYQSLPRGIRTVMKCTVIHRGINDDSDRVKYLFVFVFHFRIKNCF